MMQGESPTPVFNAIPLRDDRCCAPRLAETPFSGRDPQEGDDDDDRDNRTDWGRSGPGRAPVAQTQARCGAAYAPGGRSRDTLARPGRDGCNPERMAGQLPGRW